MTAYYNEIEPAAAHVLECLIKDGVIAPGIVDRRSVADVEPKDVQEFTQAHFFAGGGLWSVAARIAGFPDDRALWTGSCPCQPFSVAGKGKGVDDARHLWPHFHRLITACRPAIILGEQVSGKAGYGWFDGVRSDLEGEDYTCEAFDIPACSYNAPHIRQRLYWVALDDTVRGRHGNAEKEIRAGWNGALDASGNGGALVNADSAGGNSRDMADTDDAQRGTNNTGRNNGDRNDAGREKSTSHDRTCCESFWHAAEWLTGSDGKSRRAKPGVRLLVDARECVGRVPQLRIAGNAIVAPLAAVVIQSVMETIDETC